MPMTIKQALGEIPSYQRRIIALLEDPENFVLRLRKEIIKPLGEIAEVLNTDDDITTPLDSLIKYFDRHFDNKSVDVKRIQEIASKWTGLEPEEDDMSLSWRRKKVEPIRNNKNGINGEEGKPGKGPKKPSTKAKVIEVEQEEDDELMMKPSLKAGKKAGSLAAAKRKAAKEKAANESTSGGGSKALAGKANTWKNVTVDQGGKGIATAAGGPRIRSGNNRVKIAEKIASEDDMYDSEMAMDGEVANIPRRKADENEEDESEETLDEEDESEGDESEEDRREVAIDEDEEYEDRSGDEGGEEDADEEEGAGEVSEEDVEPNKKVVPLVRTRRRRAAKPVPLIKAEKPCSQCVVKGKVCLVPLDSKHRACSKCKKDKKKCNARPKISTSDEISDGGAAARLHKEATTALLESFMGFKHPAEQPENDMDVEMGSDGEVVAAEDTAKYSSLVEALPAGIPLILYELRALRQSNAKLTLRLDVVEGLLSNDLLEKRQVAQTRQDTQGTSKVAVERRGGVKANAYQSAEGDSVLTSRLDSTSTITRGNISPFRKTKKATPAVSPPPQDRSGNQAANSPLPVKEKKISFARKFRLKNLAVPAVSPPPSENEDEHARPIHGSLPPHPLPELADDVDFLVVDKAPMLKTKKSQAKLKKISGADAPTKKRKVATQAEDDEDGPPAKKNYSGNRKNEKKSAAD